MHSRQPEHWRAAQRWAVAAALALGWATASSAPAVATEVPITRATPTEVPTAYVALWLAEHTWVNGPSPRGGAITVAGDQLLVASGDGRFFQVDLVRLRARADALPALDLGAQGLAASRRYKSFELPPRVHDILADHQDVYVSFDQYSPPTDSIHFNIAKLAPDGKSWVSVYRSIALDSDIYTMGNGGRLALQASTRRLFFTVGDHSLDRHHKRASDIAAQQPGLPWGKVGYIDLRDNSVHPFSLGHRNPQGLTFLADGRLMESEHGPQGGDEINEIREGANYGWPYRSYGTEYGGRMLYSASLPPEPPGLRFVEPLHAFVPSVAPTQLLQVQAFHTRWNGDLLMGSLKAQTLFRIKLAADRVLFVEPIPLARRIRDVRQMRDTLVILTDQGSLLTLRRTPGLHGSR